jgi:hypothetical protein
VLSGRHSAGPDPIDDTIEGDWPYTLTCRGHVTGRNDIPGTAVPLTRSYEQAVREAPRDTSLPDQT